MAKTERQIVDFRKFANNRFTGTLLGFSQRLLDPVLRTSGLEESYRNLLVKRAVENGGKSFFDQGLEVLGVEYEVNEKDLRRIPESGPVFLVANHPYGGVDGLILGSILDRVRSDGKLLVNFLLDRIDHMGGRCFYVDPFGSRKSKRTNLRGIRESYRWLREGHALGTFPSGTVSYLRLTRRRVTDPLWAENLAPLIMKTGATVVPVYFAGRNSNLFQIAGLMNPRLRTALLGREMLASQERRIEVRIGNPIPARQLARFSGSREIMDFLRLRTYILQSREVADKTVFLPDARKASTGQPIVEAQALEDLEKDIASLPPEALMAEHNCFGVYAVRAGQIPHVMRELGRLREITFREVGEGTGEEVDLDKFDEDYWHLFIWNRKEKDIVGAYRLGLTDEILPLKGKQGLYTTTLFRFKTKVIASLGPSIELGRSFVVAKYQRKPVSLGLLWKGIGQFIVRNPKYRILFGPVSISNDYQSLSRNLIVTYLREHNLDAELAHKVKARNPLKARQLGSLDRGSFKRSVRDIEEVSALISEIEREAKGVPVLLRQYLKLNASILSFNVDPAFNDSLDGLVLVDLRKTHRRTLERYMTAEGAREFLEFHGCLDEDGPGED